jgi:hypothetical protein
MNMAKVGRQRRGSQQRIGDYSSEQSHATNGIPEEIRGGVRSVTLREG